MEIINQSIRIIDYENNEVYKRDTPEEFSEYVKQLITYIDSNTSIREYKTRSVNTEVISCILDIIKKKEDIDFVTLSIPWWRSHPIHENRTTESIWTEPCNPLLRATKSTKRATSIYEITLIFYLIFE